MTPTNKDLLTSIYSDTHNAASVVSKAYAREQFNRSDAEECLRLLRAACAAMESLASRIRGVPPPKVGD
jgi:hypothetical protein